MTVWRKLTYDLAEDMQIPSEHNIRNMSAVKMAYQFNVRCDLCLWNAESKIVQQNWYSYTQTHIQRYTHTKHMQAYTHRHRHTITHAHKHVHAHTALHRHTTHTHTHPANKHWSHTAEFLKAKSKLCDGIQCRLTARTAGSTKGELLASELDIGKSVYHFFCNIYTCIPWNVYILASELGKKQADQVKRPKSSPQ